MHEMVSITNANNGGSWPGPGRRSLGQLHALNRPCPRDLPDFHGDRFAASGPKILLDRLVERLAADKALAQFALEQLAAGVFR